MNESFVDKFNTLVKYVVELEERVSKLERENKNETGNSAKRNGYSNEKWRKIKEEYTF